MSEKDLQAALPAVPRKTGNVRRPAIQETADPSGKKPVAQWVISGSIARPAHEVLPEPAPGANNLPARAEARPAWWLLGAAAAVGFAVAIPVTWLVFSLFAR